MQSETHKFKAMSNIQLAKQKAAALRTNSMVRLTANPESLWVYNMNGRAMIGYPVCSPVPHLLDSAKPTYKMKNKSEEVTDIVQFL
jgi:hypothetical protein